MKKNSLFRQVVLGFALILLPNGLQAQVVVIVGHADSEKIPLLFDNLQDGLAPEFVAELNAIQKKYHFEFRLYPAKRLVVQAADPKAMDVIAFGNMSWLGPSAADFSPTLPLMRSTETFFTLATPNRDQTYFEQATKKSLAAVLGYHYAFAGFNSDPSHLKGLFKIDLVKDEFRVIRMVLENRAEVGIAEDSNLAYYKATNPENYKKLLIAQKPDNQFTRGFLVRRTAPISVPDFNSLIVQLNKSGRLAAVFSKYGLPVPQL